MRWADLDQLDHVNNVVYVDYATEALAAHAEAGELELAESRHLRVDYLRPLLLSRTPVEVTTEAAADGTTVQDIRPAGAEAAFARVTSSPRAPVLDPVAPGGVPFAVRVRRSDLGPDGAVCATKLFEIGQESRIVSVERLREAGDIGGIGAFVVARVDVLPAAPVRWRSEPYTARTRVLEVGRKSFTLTTSLEDGELGRIDAVLVGFDLEQQRSRELTDREREALEAQR